MPTSLLYFLTALIWGTSWSAITLQTGVVPVELSIAIASCSPRRC